MKKIYQKFKSLKESAKGSYTWGAFYKGNRLKTDSGKMSWNSIGAAKNAIRLSLYYIARKEGFKSSSELCKNLEEKDLLTYKILN